MKGGIHMKNTENYEMFLKLCSEYKKTGNRKILSSIIRIKHTLASTGCYSQNNQRMQWRCFIADNIGAVKHYIAVASKSKQYQDDDFYRYLESHKMPTNPETLKSLVTLIKRGAIRHDKNKKHWKRKNGQPLPIKYAADALNQEDTISQDDIDEEMQNTFLGKIAANQ